MAASNGVLSDNHVFLIKEKIKKEVTQELHICKCEERNTIHSAVIEGEDITNFLWRFMKSYLLTATSVKRSNAYFQFLQKANSERNDFLIVFSSIGNSSDLNELFNFYSSCTFDFLKRLPREHISLNIKEDQIPIPSAYINETNAALYRLGGGTMGEIWKVSKKWKKTSCDISEAQRNKCRKLYEQVFLYRMTQDEKKANLSVELLNRDRGGMFFPKASFLPFIQEVNECVRNFANPKALQIFQETMIKECVAQVSKLEKIKELFAQAASSIDVPESIQDQDREHFFNIWIRKIVHARVQEFVSSHFEGEKQRLKKGGHTLRDKLYAAVHKKRDVNRVKKAKIARKSNKISRPLVSKKEAESTASPVGVSALKRVKRVPKKLMYDDYVYD